MQILLLSARACIAMNICMSSQQKTLVYALRQEVPKLVYAFWTCKPVNHILQSIQKRQIYVRMWTKAGHHDLYQVEF